MNRKIPAVMGRIGSVVLVVLVVLFASRAEAQLGPFLPPARAQALLQGLAVPAEIASATWEPKVTSWWLSPRLATVLSGAGSDGAGASPFMLGSPVPYKGPPQRHITAVNEKEDWRLGYVNLGKDGREQQVAFLVKLPPGWDKKYPGRGISRVVQLASGSGDCRARSALGDLADFNPPGVLFVVFDLRQLSMALPVPDSPGALVYGDGKNYIYRSLGIGKDVPWDIWGYSAGGATALHALFFPELAEAHSLVAISPIFLPWNAYARDNYVPGAPAVNPWAALYALGTSEPAAQRKYFDHIAALVQGVIPEAVYERGNPVARLARGDTFSLPALLIAGSEDSLGASRSVLPALMYQSAWQGKGYLAYYTAQDYAEKRSVDFKAIAAQLMSARSAHKKNQLVGVLLEGGTHALTTPYGLDVRSMALKFSESIP